MVLEDRFVFVAQNVAGLEESGQVSVSGSTARDGTLGKVLFKKLCRYFAGLPRAIVFSIWWWCYPWDRQWMRRGQHRQAHETRSQGGSNSRP